jgi:hypothetical protein
MRFSKGSKSPTSEHVPKAAQERREDVVIVVIH